MVTRSKPRLRDDSQKAVHESNLQSLIEWIHVANTTTYEVRVASRSKLHVDPRIQWAHEVFRPLDAIHVSCLKLHPVAQEFKIFGSKPSLSGVNLLGTRIDLRWLWVTLMWVFYNMSSGDRVTTLLLLCGDHKGAVTQAGSWFVENRRLALIWTINLPIHFGRELCQVISYSGPVWQVMSSLYPELFTGSSRGDWNFFFT